MKAQLCTSSARAMSTLEVLIAFTLLTLGITAALLVVFGTRAFLIDAYISGQALTRIDTFLERTRASKQNFSDIISTSNVWESGSRTYLERISVTDYSRCQKNIIGNVAWKDTPLRVQEVALLSVFVSIKEALALGGDCGVEEMLASWTLPKKLFGGKLSSGTPIAVDELNGVLYGGSTVSPYFFIVNTKNVSDEGGTSFISFSNGFMAPAPVVAVDVVVWRTSTFIKQYAYVALDATSSQMAVIDVTDPYSPALVAVRTLKNVSPDGSEPSGHLLYYYSDRLYVLTRYTAGPEMHIFDVSDPLDPVELGNGVELGVTVNGFAVEDQVIGGMRRRFAYMATSQLGGELKVYEVTDPTNNGIVVEISAARQDLPGAQNGLSVYVLGNKLFFGRASTPEGPDLYVFDKTNPVAGLPLMASQDIGTGVSALVAVGNIIIMATPKSKKEIQIWNLSDTVASLVSTYALSGASFGGFDYASGIVYATGQGESSVDVITGY